MNEIVKTLIECYSLSPDFLFRGHPILSGAEGEREKWRSVSESVPTEWNPDLVTLPVEYKWFTVTKEPHCLNPEWCNGLMLFGGHGCEAEDENCDFYQDSYVTYINSDGSKTYKNTNWHNPGANGFTGRVIRWEMPNKEGYRTIDSVLDRDSGFLVHAQTFKCKGFGLNIIKVIPSESGKDDNGFQSNGTAYEIAQTYKEYVEDWQDEDLKFLDEIFADCADKDYQGHGLELEVYKFDYADRTWNGPYWFWSSELYETSQKWNNIKDWDLNALR